MSLLQRIARFKPCSEGCFWLAYYDRCEDNGQKAWDECGRPEWMIWLLTRAGVDRVQVMRCLLQIIRPWLPKATPILETRRCFDLVEAGLEDSSPALIEFDDSELHGNAANYIVALRVASAVSRLVTLHNYWDHLNDVAYEVAERIAHARRAQAYQSDPPGTEETQVHITNLDIACVVRSFFPNPPEIKEPA